MKTYVNIIITDKEGRLHGTLSAEDSIRDAVQTIVKELDGATSMKPAFQSNPMSNS